MRRALRLAYLHHETAKKDKSLKIKYTKNIILTFLFRRNLIALIELSVLTGRGELTSEYSVTWVRVRVRVRVGVRVTVRVGVRVRVRVRVRVGVGVRVGVRVRVTG